MLFRDPIKGQSLLDELSSTPHHGTGCHLITQQGLNAPAQRRYITVLHQKPSTSFLDEFTTSTIIRHHHGGATQKAFKWHQTKNERQRGAARLGGRNRKQEHYNRWLKHILMVPIYRIHLLLI